MKGYAQYTVESRAIPNMIDGLKPVQRFYLYSSLKNSRSEFRKVSAIAGVISDYGYNHGEVSAAGAGQLMAAEWSNNICLVKGRGAFGSRQVPVAGASRYIYTKVHDNFDRYITDINLSPVHSDPEHEPPKFYLPCIPLVLSNGAFGIATGFSTNILPRSTESIIQCCNEYITDGKVSTIPMVSFPMFKGNVSYNTADGKWYARGLYTLVTPTRLDITEIPPDISREKFVALLDKLEDSDEIVGYTDLCDDTGFRFTVSLKRGNGIMSDEKIIKMFKLEKSFSENLTVIDFAGKLRIYDDPRKLIEDFCEYRLSILQERISIKKSETEEEVNWLSAKKAFIDLILDGKLTFRGKSKAVFATEIKTSIGCSDDYAERLMRLNIVSLTAELVVELEKQIKESTKELTYWKTKATPKEQFCKDLVAL
jgi:DNA topoisomerase-2